MSLRLKLIASGMFPGYYTLDVCAMQHRRLCRSGRSWTSSGVAPAPETVRYQGLRNLSRPRDASISGWLSSQSRRRRQVLMSDPRLSLYEMLRILKELRSDTSSYRDVLASRLGALLRRRKQGSARWLARPRRADRAPARGVASAA